MLVFESKYSGRGIFDKIIQSGIAQKVINSATTENLKRAANSTIGKEIQKSVLTGLTNATEDVAKHTLSTIKRKRRKKNEHI